MADTVEFCGESFALPDRIGLMPLMRFAKVAKAGVDTVDMDGLAAIYDLLRQCIREEDWQRFEALADEHRSDADELLEVTKQVIAAVSERPTSRPTDSSAGPSTTGTSSADALSSRVIERLEGQGRPDLALMVVQAQEQRAS